MKRDASMAEMESHGSAGREDQIRKTALASYLSLQDTTQQMALLQQENYLMKQQQQKDRNTAFLNLMFP
jgi:hypothetical protein